MNNIKRTLYSMANNSHIPRAHFLDSDIRDLVAFREGDVSKVGVVP